jgi:hypothetical protein
MFVFQAASTHMISRDDSLFLVIPKILICRDEFFLIIDITQARNQI